ncbi:MAG: ligand-binding sensor domain-containing protein [Flavobacteriales bacterium]|jgi:ligand-binding sensor domain-containing protein
MKKSIAILFLSISISASAQTFTSYTEEDGLVNNTVLCVDVDENDDVWFGTQEGISFFDGSDWTNYTSDDGLVFNTVWGILMDSQGILWAGTDFGISKLDGGVWTTYTTDDGLEDNRIKHIYESTDGLIWFGNNDGVSSFDGSTFTNYTTDDGLPFGGVAHVNQDNNGNMWFGTGLGGAFMFDGTDFTQIDEDNGLLSVAVRSVAVDASNKKWIGTNTGVSVFDNDNEHVEDHDAIFTLPAPHEINPVVDVKIDSQGRVWVGLYIDYLVSVGGISLYVGGEWLEYDEDDGLAGPAVAQLAIDSEDNVWVATSSGVTKIGDAPVGISETYNEALSAYPNPSTGVLTLVPSLESNKVEVYTLSSRLVFSQQVINSGTMRMDLSNLPGGMYIVKSGSSLQRIVLQ